MGPVISYVIPLQRQLAFITTLTPYRLSTLDYISPGRSHVNNGARSLRIIELVIPAAQTLHCFPFRAHGARDLRKILSELVRRRYESRSFNAAKPPGPESLQRSHVGLIEVHSEKFNVDI